MKGKKLSIRAQAKELTETVTAAVLKQVITALLKEPERAVRTGENDLQTGIRGVTLILERVHPTQDIVDHAVDTALARYREKRAKSGGYFFASDYLCAAGGYLHEGASRERAEAVILEMARAGFHGRLQGMTKQYLDRNPTSTEVGFLVHAYTADTASRGESTEDCLREYIQKWVPSHEERCALNDEIDAFIRNWNALFD